MLSADSNIEKNHAALAPRLAALLAGTAAVLVGGVVLIGWALDVAALKSVLPGWVSMKPNAAVAFILAGIAVLLSHPPSTLNCFFPLCPALCVAGRVDRSAHTGRIRPRLESRL